MLGARHTLPFGAGTGYLEFPLNQGLPQLR